MSENVHVVADDDCCRYVKDCDEHLQILDICFKISSDFSDLEKSTHNITFLVGLKRSAKLVHKKLKTMNHNSLKFPEDIHLQNYKEYEYLFAFFKSRNKKSWSKFLLEAYKSIYETTPYKFINIQSILRRFNNSFFKTFTCDKLKQSRVKKKIKKRCMSRRYILFVLEAPRLEI